MRVSTAFNRILAIEGATVTGVRIEGTSIVVAIRARRRRLRCPCGTMAPGRYDQRRRRWRHIDMAGAKVHLEATVRRMWCRTCGRVRTEQVPWARPGGRHTHDLEQLVLWLAQRMDRTAVSTLLRIGWASVSSIVERAVTEQLDPGRLRDVRRIGVDEVSYRYRRYLTLVVDHDRGAVLWVAEGKGAAALEGFFAALGDATGEIEAVSMDLGNAYRVATERSAPTARICIDPFHVIQLANRAVTDAIRWAQRSGTLPRDRTTQRIRSALSKGAASLDEHERVLLAHLRRERNVAWRAWVLKEDLRALYAEVDPADADAYLDRWVRRAARSRIPPLIRLARTVGANREGILDAIALGLSNGRLEGTASKVRLINHRGYGHHSIAALAAMIYLCCGAVTTGLPHR